MSNHTKGKWEVHRKNIIIVKNPTSRIVAGTTSSHLSVKETEANARRICLCVNSHDALLEACKGLLPYIISEWEGTDGCLMCRRPMRYHANDCVIGKAEQAIEEAKNEKST